MPKISFYPNHFISSSKETIDLQEYFQNVLNGKWQDVVLPIRAETDEKKKKEKKDKSPAVTISGYFSENRNAAKLTTHSGVLCIDIDFKDNPKIMDKRAELGGDEYVFAFHTSISGKGVALFFKINPNKHLESYLAIEKYLAENYHIICDPSCKDTSRLRYISYDPELYLNSNAKKWNIYLAKEVIIPHNYNPVFSRNDIDYCIKQLNNKYIDLTASYHDWIRIGFAFANEFGEGGRSYFHEVSKNHPQYSYNKVDNKYSSLLKSNHDKTHIGTFFFLCKQADISIKSEKTQIIEKIARVRRQSIGKNGGETSPEKAKENAKKYLREIENITEEECTEIIEKVFNLSEKELNITEKDSEIAYVTEYINSLSAKFNEITKKTEISGEAITDKILNSIYLTCKEMYPKANISKDLIDSIMNSDRIKSYNPIKSFIDRNKFLKPSGNVEKLISCIKMPNNIYKDYAEVFICKWLVSIMASIHGTYSLLILVLIGEQCTNKTKFFRYIIPDELKSYYAESKMDEGKDSEILLAEKLLIIDDEFGGKSKKEAEKLKELSSKQIITHRKPYARNVEDFYRLAVLGGTSNEKEILNDPTGNRRILPIYVKDIDIQKVETIDKTELFIEIYWLWRQMGDTWMLSKEEIKLLNDNTAEFTEISMEEDLISKCFKLPVNGDYPDFLTATEMISICEAKLNKQRLYHKKFGQILRKLGFERIIQNKVYGYKVVKINQV